MIKARDLNGVLELDVPLHSCYSPASIFSFLFCCWFYQKDFFVVISNRLTTSHCVKVVEGKSYIVQCCRLFNPIYYSFFS